MGQAGELLAPALQHYEASGNVAGAADVHSRIAMVYAEQYRVGPALAADLETMRLYTALGNQHRAADGALNSGASYVLCGAWDLAEQHTTTALAYFRKAADTLIMPSRSASWRRSTPEEVTWPRPNAGSPKGSTASGSSITHSACGSSSRSGAGS